MELPLPFDLDRYFNRQPEAVEIDVACLKPMRARPQGIHNARRCMRLAYEGSMPKREPISVVRSGENTFVILDGNSTYAVAVSSNWPRIMAIVFESEQNHGAHRSKSSDPMK